MYSKFVLPNWTVFSHILKYWPAIIVKSAVMEYVDQIQSLILQVIIHSHTCPLEKEKN